jgi:spermidine synthase
LIEHELLGTAQIPGQTGELHLYRHDGDFTFRVRGIELMSSRVHGSEELLAELALRRLLDTHRARVLIGGLGMGFTLARVLCLVGDAAEVEVAELVPEVVDWNRRWIGQCNGHPLRDRRVQLIEGDVAPCIRGARGAYDAILLDVDNGPEGLVLEANDWLYSETGLAAAGAALRPGGVLAVWSSSAHPWFTDRLQDTGFAVAERRVRARRTRGPRRTIWLAEPAVR